MPFSLFIEDPGTTVKTTARRSAKCVPDRLPVLLVGLPEDRVVRRRALLGRPAVGVVVERDRLAAPPRRAGERLRMAVVGEVRGAEDHRAVEHRQDLPLAAGHVAVPQLELPSILLPPVLV